MESDDPNSIVMLLCTVPNEETGVNIAKSLTREGLAACVNIIPNVRSIYRWQGEICDDSELLLFIKTIRLQVNHLMSRVVELHPYTTPEVLSVLVPDCSPPYLEWVQQSCQSPANGRASGRKSTDESPGDQRIT